MIEAKHSPPDYPTTRFFMELAVNLINEAVSNRNGSSSPIRENWGSAAVGLKVDPRVPASRI